MLLNVVECSNECWNECSVDEEITVVSPVMERSTTSMTSQEALENAKYYHP